MCVCPHARSQLFVDGFSKKFYLKANQKWGRHPLHFFKIRYWVRSVTKNERSEIRVAEHSFFEKGGFQVVSVFFFSVRDVTRGVLFRASWPRAHMKGNLIRKKLLGVSFWKIFSIDRYYRLSIFPILKKSAKIAGFSDISGHISGTVESIEIILV